MFAHAAMTASGSWIVSFKAGETVIASGEGSTVAEARDNARKALESRATIPPSKAA